MSKTTAASIERDLPDSLNSFKSRAAEAKAQHRVARQAIKDDEMTSDLAKKEKLAELDRQTRSRLDALKAEQESYVSGLKSKIERELRGNQPGDAASVVSRRDAADRARQIQDKTEAMEVLRDAIRNGDADLAHAIGAKARNSVWGDVAEAYTAAHPDTADSAQALAYVEANTSGAAYNLNNGITYAAPLD